MVAKRRTVTMNLWRIRMFKMRERLIIKKGKKNLKQELFIKIREQRETTRMFAGLLQKYLFADLIYSNSNLSLNWYLGKLSYTFKMRD